MEEKRREEKRRKGEEEGEGEGEGEGGGGEHNRSNLPTNRHTPGANASSSMSKLVRADEH